MRTILLILGATFLAACDRGASNNRAVPEDQMVFNDADPPLTSAPPDQNTGALTVEQPSDSNDVRPPPPMVTMSAPPPPGMEVGGEAPPSVPAPDGNVVAATEAPGTPYCATVRRYVTVAECARYREQQAQLERGVSAFRAPPRMLVGVASEVRLAIGRPEDAAEVAATAGGSTDDRRTKMGATRIGRIMRATLQGTGFDVVAVGEAERDLGGTSEEVWIWRVTPRDQGEHQLTAVLEVLAERGDSARERLAIYRSNATIAVDVTAAQKSAAAHQSRLTTLGRVKELLLSTEGVLGALASVLAAVGLVVWRVRRIGKKPGDSDSSGGTGTGGA